MYDVVVIGGGVVGLSIAWRTAERGLAVAVVDPGPGSGASHAAAGMLAPISEVAYTEEPSLRLGRESLALWPAFAADLSAAAAVDLDLRADGTLAVAYDSDDLAVLTDLAAFEESLGIAVERLTGRECRRLEPMLAPVVRGGLLARDDLWVNPRRVVRALLTALARAGVAMVPGRASGLVDGGVRLTRGEVVPARQTVVATGAWTAELGLGLPIRPVKGQIMRLRGPAGLLTRCVRGLVRGTSVYLVPRADGEITVGATQEELGFDTRVTAGGMWELLRDARELVPGITELEIVEFQAGLRPGTPDNLPVIGRIRPDVVAATGHHRGGILLAPLTADGVVAMLTGEQPSQILKECDPGRFDGGNH
ncbi:glycine oxidase ThiO [Rhizohabitans arisaemae]|uniref:glycine oxidase ThiO n=1 Tax=Rhizohabitans arisaemae TaxID=2720610 RepID=UPI0024B163DD|nr:glycine oxidase ThiO [Rhizohabitans arisaemae]